MTGSFDQLRIKVVEAVWKASGCRIGMCTSLDCGHIDIERLFPVLGITHLSYGRDGTQYEFSNWHKDEAIAMDQRDALSILNILMTYGNLKKNQLFKGFMEVPKVIGELLHERGWNEKLKNGDLQSPWMRDAVRKEFLLALVGEAFPDEYLHQVKNGDISFQSGYEIANEFAKTFENNGYVSPRLTSGIIDNLSQKYSTSHFSFNNEQFDNWSIGSAYTFGMNRDMNEIVAYWNDFPSLPDAFEYAEHSNQGGCGMCFIARSSQILVVQQLWTGWTAGEFNKCTSAFNEYLFPLMENDEDADSGVIVAFSDFRDFVCILSTVPESWDPYSPVGAIDSPLPQGFGIVGVWSNYDENRYTPRPFDEIIKSGYSAQITASAQYLNACLQ